MSEPSSGESQSSPSSRPPSSTRFFLITLFIGVMMGIVLMILLGYGLYYFGYVTIPGETSQSTVQITEVKVPVCPTCEPESEAPKILIVTPASSSTQQPDAAATCEAYSAQYPGTPCPTSANP